MLVPSLGDVLPNGWTVVAVGAPPSYDRTVVVLACGAKNGNHQYATWLYYMDDDGRKVTASGDYYRDLSTAVTGFYDRCKVKYTITTSPERGVTP